MLVIMFLYVLKSLGYKLLSDENEAKIAELDAKVIKYTSKIESLKLEISINENLINGYKESQNLSKNLKNKLGTELFEYLIDGYNKNIDAITEIKKKIYRARYSIQFYEKKILLLIIKNEDKNKKISKYNRKIILAKEEQMNISDNRR